MRRSLAVLATAGALAVGASVATAGAAVAAPADAALGSADERSVLFYCPGSPDQAHPGRHRGWDRSPSTERRNVGGTCPAG